MRNQQVLAISRPSSAMSDRVSPLWRERLDGWGLPLTNRSSLSLDELGRP